MNHKITQIASFICFNVMQNKMREIDDRIKNIQVAAFHIYNIYQHIDHLIFAGILKNIKIEFLIKEH